MKCENKFCVYRQEDQCILDEISLDVMGCCQSCIYVDMEEDTLQAARQRFLDRERQEEATFHMCAY